MHSLIKKKRKKEELSSSYVKNKNNTIRLHYFVK